jgi:sugar phosphate isomerase/epimerase
MWLSRSRNNLRPEAQGGRRLALLSHQVKNKQFAESGYWEGKMIVSRRRFLGTASLAFAGGACLPPPAKASKRLNKIGLQLYTLRNEMKDFTGTLEKVAAIGYKEVEFAGYFDRKPQEVKATLDRLGLTAPSAHAPLASVDKNLGGVIEAAKVIGHKFIVCPYLMPNERATLADYHKLSVIFNRAGEACKKAGIEFAYHNHDFEFVPLDGKMPYDVLLAETDPKLVKMELDLYWIVKAGQDPLPYLGNHPGRFPLVHVKDMDNTPKKDFTEVGRGTIDFKRIFAMSKKAGIRHYFVEQDRSDSPLESIKVSYDYLSKLKF